MKILALLLTTVLFVGCSASYITPEHYYTMTFNFEQVKEGNFFISPQGDDREYEIIADISINYYPEVKEVPVNEAYNPNHYIRITYSKINYLVKRIEPDKILTSMKTEAVKLNAHAVLFFKYEIKYRPLFHTYVPFVELSGYAVKFYR